MTKIPLPPKPKNYQNTPPPPKPKNDRNTPQNFKMAKRPPKTKKITKIIPKPKN